MQMHAEWQGLLLGLAILLGAAVCSGQPLTLHVSVHGNDTWSGTLPKPNADATDGPFAGLKRARDEIRKQKPKGATILVHEGTYFLQEPLALGPEDSGTKDHPIVYRAQPGAQVILSGGRRIPGPWQSEDGKLYRTRLPEVEAGKWFFRQLRVGTERQTRARYPNFAPENPWLGGFHRVAQCGFQAGLGCLQEKGTWLEYDIDVPADGDYAVRLYYANNGQTNTRFFGFTDMSNRTTLSVDGGEPVRMADMTDTKSFYSGFRWAEAGKLRLTKGKHVLRWTNTDGGALSLLAILLTNDPGYVPPGPTARPDTCNAIILEAQKYDRKHGDKVQEMKFIDRKDPVLRTNLAFHSGDLKQWPKSPDAEIFVIPEYDWVSQLVRLVSVDETNGIARIEGANATKPFMPENRYYAVNVLEELDVPGEWCLVRKTGTLYYRPKAKDFDKQEIVAPVLDRLIELRGTKDKPVRHIHIEGFTFADTRYTSPERLKDTYHADDAALWLWAAQHCRIADNTFRDVGGYGIMLRDASTHNKIAANEIAGAGQGGIYLNGFADEPRKAAPEGQRPAHNTVVDNYAHHCGWFYVHVAGIQLACADDNLIAHNEIHDTTRYGISLKQKCPRNVIEYNDVRRTNLATRDTGAIEMCNRSGCIVRYNLVVDTIGCGFEPRAGKHTLDNDAGGIYLDNMSSNVHVHGNIVVRSSQGVWLNWGDNNLIENNIFVGSRDRGVLLCCWRDKPGWRSKGNRFLRNVVCVTDPDVPVYCVSGKKHTKDILDCDHNLVYAAGQEPSLSGTGDIGAKGWAGWRKQGQDEHSIVADPLFVDPEKGDYRLKPDSPALKLGFKPIPVEKIGRRKR